MQKALRNTSGKPTTVENLDKRDQARQGKSANPVVKDLARLDAEREKTRAAQARQEQHQGPDVGQNETEFNVRSQG